MFDRKSCLCSADSVFSSGAGVRSRKRSVLEQAMLWRGLLGERQPSEVLFHPCVRYQGECAAGTPHALCAHYCEFPEIRNVARPRKNTRMESDSNVINRFIIHCFVCLFVFVLQDGKTKFEQELYTNFTSNSSRPYFITFPGDVSLPASDQYA